MYCDQRLTPTRPCATPSQRPPTGEDTACSQHVQVTAAFLPINTPLHLPHTAYRTTLATVVPRRTLIYLCLHTKFHSNRTNFSDGWTDIETGFGVDLKITTFLTVISQCGTKIKGVGTVGATGAKVSFRPRNVKFIRWLHRVLHSRTAGELTRRTQHAPTLLAAGAKPTR